jgi:eukaryotic-like serine/threonine-protein kinase
MDNQSLRKIGKYELLEFLGGGMSHVYRAVDPVLGRTLAVKILTEAGNADPEARARFLQEARISSNIIHDNIIRIHDYGEEQGRPYMVMEFLVGEDLRHAIRNGNTGDIQSRLKIALQAARALGFVHQAEVIHRDIKPENIHVDQSGRVRLMDFGIAKSQGLSLTRTGFAMGTPYYMSPEQVLGKPATRLMDIYSFGVLLFELLTGVRPIESDTVERLFYMILHEPIDLTPLTDNGVPAEVVNLVARCTAKAPEDRPQSFQEICAELERLLGGAAPVMSTPTMGALAPPDTPAQAAKTPSGQAVAEVETPAAAGPRKVVSTASIVAAGGLVLALGVAIALYFHYRTPKPAPASSSTQTKSPQKLPDGLNTATGYMVLVPAGPFERGIKDEIVNLPAFYIDKTEVSNEAYERFAAAKQLKLPPDFPRDKPAYPAVNVSFNDAMSFCEWAGKRLPSGDEWEKAARGTTGRLYSWGNDADPNKANVNPGSGTGGLHLDPVNSHPDGAGQFGTLNMTGNVLEWVNEPMNPSPKAIQIMSGLLSPPPTGDEPWYVVRGGSYDRSLAAAVAYEYISMPARFRAGNIGFRCAANPPAGN